MQIRHSESCSTINTFQHVACRHVVILTLLNLLEKIVPEYQTSRRPCAELTFCRKGVYSERTVPATKIREFEMERKLLTFEVLSFPHRVKVRLAKGDLEDISDEAPRWLYSTDSLDDISRHIDLNALKKPLAFKCLKPNMYCIIRHPKEYVNSQERHCFYRAELKKIIVEKKLCRVFLVDRGEEILCENTHLFDIQKQPAYVWKTPMGAFKCHLDAVSKKLASKNLEREYTLLITAEVGEEIYQGHFEEGDCGQAANVKSKKNDRQPAFLRKAFNEVLTDKQRHDLEVAKCREEIRKLLLEKETERKKRIKAVEEKTKVLEEKDRLEKEYNKRLKEDRDSCRFAVDELRKQVKILEALNRCCRACSRIPTVDEACRQQQQHQQLHTLCCYDSRVNHLMFDIPPEDDNSGYWNAASGVGTSGQHFDSDEFYNIAEEETTFVVMGCSKCRQPNHVKENCPYVWKKKKGGKRAEASSKPSTSTAR